MQHNPSDMKRIKTWLEKEGGSIGFTLAQKENGIETWKITNRTYLYRVIVTEDLSSPSVMDTIEKNIKEIAKAAHWTIEEAEKEVLLAGLHLDDIIPFSNQSHEGMILQWSSRIGFGEYTLYRERNEEVLLPWNGDSECMDREDKRYLKELMRQFIEKVEVRL